MIKRLFYTLVFLLFASWGFAVTYTVDGVNGTDSGTCVGASPSTECETIQYVFSNEDLGENDIVEIESDTYREEVTWGSNDEGTSGNPVILRAKSGHTVIISGADIMSSWTSYSGNTWQKTGVTTEPQNVWMDDTALTEGSDRDSLSDHEWVWDTNVLYVRDDTGNPDSSGVVIEASQRDNGIYGVGIDFVTVDGQDGLTIEKTLEEGVHFDENGEAGQDITIQNLVVQETGGDGIRMEPTGFVIDNCVIHDVGRQGDNSKAVGIRAISGWGITSGTISDNTIYNAYTNQGQCINISNSADGITITRNHVKDCYDDGIKLYDGSINNIIEFNKVESVGDTEGTGNCGIAIYSSSAATTGNKIRWNTVFGSWSAGIELLQLDTSNGDISNTYIYGNVVYENATGGTSAEIRIAECDGANYVYNNLFVDGGNYGIWLDNSSANQVIKNNISANNANEDFIAESGATTGHTIDYNLYYRASGDAWDWGGTQYDISTGWANYKTASSQDANSPTPASPAFIDDTNDNYALSSSSPAINAGDNLGASYDDALLPGSESPNDVQTGDQDDCLDWEIGAYRFGLAIPVTAGSQSVVVDSGSQSITVKP